MRLIALAGGWLLGLYAASQAGLPDAALIAGIPVALAAAVLLRRRWRTLLAALLLTGVFAGALRFELHERVESERTLSAYHGEQVVLRVVVATYPDDLRTSTRFQVTAREIETGGQRREVSGRALVTARAGRDLARDREPPYVRIGDLLELRGRLERPRSFSDFDFPAYLAQQGVRSVMEFPRVALVESGHGPLLDRALARARGRLSRALEDTLPEPQNGLAQGLLLGIRSDIDRDLNEDFRRSGTSHILAISGQNVAVLMGLVLLLARRFLGRPWAFPYVITGAVIWLYVLNAGLPPSAERAAIMGSFYLAALALGRQQIGLQALLLAALVITAFAPRDLWQVSFQLSFLAMAGMVLAMPRAQEALAQGRPAGGNWAALAVRYLMLSIAMSAVATLFTLPVVAFYFHQISLVGVPATALALPALLPALALSALTALVGLASSEAAWLFAWGAWLSLSAMIWAVQLFAALPLASVRVGEVARAWLGLYYAALLGAVWAMGRAAARWRLRLRPPAPDSWFLRAARFGKAALDGIGPPRLTPFGAASCAVALLAALVWWAALASPSKTLDVTFIDVGHGDAILVRTPSRHTVLVDGGPDPRRIVAALDRSARGGPFASRRIDLVVLTHADEDHAGGLAEVTRRYDVRRALEPGLPASSGIYTAWRRAVDTKGVPVTVARAGQAIVLGDVRIEVEHPPEPPLRGTPADENENAVVLRLTYGRFSLLLASDVQAVAEGYLARERPGLESLVLKVAHHGSATSSTEPFLEAVRPRVAVITAGNPDRFGHPSPVTVERLRRYVTEPLLFNTGRDGEVRLRTDGERLWIKTGR